MVEASVGGSEDFYFVEMLKRNKIDESLVRLAINFIVNTVIIRIASKVNVSQIIFMFVLNIRQA